MDDVRKFPNISEIKDEAAVWVVKIHGYTYKTERSIPEDQAAELRSWLTKSDLQRDYFLKMASAWDAMEMLEELADILPLRQQEPRGLTKLFTDSIDRFVCSFAGVQTKRSFPFSGVAMAACAVVMCIFLLISPQQSSYITGIGERASYTLEDGSIVTLNTNSEVRVDFSGERRVMRLLRGEANFEVAKNKARPFVVYAGQGMVLAVGTVFNVQYIEGHVDVTVSEGIVKVLTHSAPLDDELSGASSPVSSSVDNERVIGGPNEVMLIAGEAAIYKGDIISKESLKKRSIDRRLAWQSGALIFEGATLEEATKEISRYTDRQLVIVDVALREVRVGGRFKTDDIDELFDALAKSLNIKAEKDEGNQILFSAK